MMKENSMYLSLISEMWFNKENNENCEQTEQKGFSK